MWKDVTHLPVEELQMLADAHLLFGWYHAVGECALGSWDWDNRPWRSSVVKYDILDSNDGDTVTFFINVEDDGDHKEGAV